MGVRTRPSSVSLTWRRTPDVQRCFSRRCRGITTWPLEDTVVVAILLSYHPCKMVPPGRGSTSRDRLDRLRTASIIRPAGGLLGLERPHGIDAGRPTRGQVAGQHRGQHEHERYDPIRDRIERADAEEQR